jgi:guanylate kinase
MKYATRYYVLLFLLIFSCTTQTTEPPRRQPKTGRSEEETNRNSEIVKSIPNPLELCEFISDLEKKNKVKPDYKTMFLTDPADAFKYQTTFKKAINMGVYRTDLYYANHYKHLNDVIGYLNAVTHLEDEIVSSSDALRKRIKAIQNSMANAQMNLDSLIAVQSNFYFEDMQNYFRSLSKEELNAWIELGSWIEIAYLAGLYYETATDQQMAQRIAEQKFILGQLMPVLESYKERQGFDSLYPDMKELWGMYQTLEITYADDKKVIIKHLENKNLVFEEQPHKKQKEISDKQIREICRMINTIRAEVVRQ